MENKAVANLGRVVFALLMLLCSASQAQDLAEMEAEMAALEQIIQDCKKNIDYVDERILSNRPNAKDANGNWRDPAEVFPDDFMQIEWKTINYKALIKDQERAKSCMASAKSRMAMLKKDILGALKTSTIESNPGRGGLPRDPLLALKKRLLAEQALANALDQQLKGAGRLLAALAAHAPR